MNILAPSVLSADFGNLAADIKMLNASSADWIHIDVMDGVFVPNISFGFPVMKTIAQHATKELDVHLMIHNPDSYVSEFANMGANRITIHAESCTHLHRSIQLVKSLGVKVGVALNPHTSVSVLEYVHQDLDMVLLMSVNPGFGGQKFIETTFRKLKDLRGLIGNDILVQVDGGVNLGNCKALIEAGANVLVAGNAVFNTEKPMETIDAFMKKMNS